MRGTRIAALALTGLLSTGIWGLASVMPSEAEMAAANARREIRLDREEAEVVCGVGRDPTEPACARAVAASRKARNDAFVDTMTVVAVM